VLTWFLLVGATILAQRINILGLYWIGLWNVSLLAAVILATLEGLWVGRNASQVVFPLEESEGDQVVQPGEQQEAEDSETTPLLRQHVPSTNSSPARDEKTEDKAYFWWIFQFILCMTAPVLNLATIYTIWLGAMPQTIPDGGWVGIGTFYSSLLLYSVNLMRTQYMRQFRYCLSLFFCHWPPSHTKLTVCLPLSSFSSSSCRRHLSGSHLPSARTLA
jgi:hypothetical protein